MRIVTNSESEVFTLSGNDLEQRGYGNPLSDNFGQGVAGLGTTLGSPESAAMPLSGIPRALNDLHGTPYTAIDPSANIGSRYLEGARTLNAATGADGMHGSPIDSVLIASNVGAAQATFQAATGTVYVASNPVATSQSYVPGTVQDTLSSNGGTNTGGTGSTTATTVATGTDTGAPSTSATTSGTDTGVTGPTTTPDTGGTGTSTTTDATATTTTVGTGTSPTTTSTSTTTTVTSTDTGTTGTDTSGTGTTTTGTTTTGDTGTTVIGGTGTTPPVIPPVDPTPPVVPPQPVVPTPPIDPTPPLPANNAPTVAIDTVTATVAENVGGGLVIARIAVADADGDTPTVSVTGTDSSRTAYNASTGDLTLTAGLDYEQGHSRAWTITVDDGHGGVTTRTVTLGLTNVDETPTSPAWTSPSGTAIAVAESVTAGTVIGRVATTDPEGQPLTLALADDAGGTFAIDPNGDVRLVGALDFETAASRTITITATDPGGNVSTSTLTVNVTNADEPATISVTPVASVAETAPGHTTVATLSVVDPEGVAPTFSLSGRDAGLLEVSGLTVRTKSGVTLDFETANTLEFSVTTTVGAQTDTRNVSVSVTNVNETPTDVSLSVTTIAENATGTLGSLTTSDVDAGDSHAYTIVGGSDAGHFAISGNSLVVTSGFDYESGSTAQVIVRSTDAGGLSVDKTFSVSVTNMNEAPTGITLSASSIDDAATGTVGTLGVTDQDAGDSVVYSIVGGADQGHFAITGNSLAVTGAFDRSVQHTGQVVVRATDAGGLTFDRTLTVLVGAVNHAPSDLALSASTVAENATGATVGSLSTTDQDIATEGDSHTYTIVSGADSANFSISGNSLVMSSPFDFESQGGTASVTVRTTDSGGAYFDKTFSINVTDVNEAPTNVALSASTVAENVSGVTVGALSATDPDAGDVFTYSIVGGADQGHFGVSGSNLTVASPFDFEAQGSSATVVVRATDAGGLSCDKTLTITIANANETPTNISLSSSAILENATGTVGALSATDPDAGDTFTYSVVGGADQAHFGISGGNLVVTSAFDREAQSTASVVVRATDAGGLSFDKTFTVNVGNVNEAPTDITPASTTVAENVSGVLTALTTTDVDASDSHTYAVVGGADAGHFGITGSNLTLTTPFNFETQGSTAQVTVRATDAGGLFVDKTMTFTVTNANDAPTDIALSSATVAENATGTVGALSTTDEDSGDAFIYTIVGGADQAHFSIAGGNLVVSSAFDYEAQAGHQAQVTVRSTDSAGAHVDKTFTIAVTNVDEAPTGTASWASGGSITENTTGTVGTLTGMTDPEGGAVTWSLTSDPSGYFAVAANGGVMATTAPDYEAGATRTITVAATDSTGHSTSRTVNVLIGDVAEAPVFLSGWQTGGSAREQDSTGTAVGTVGVTAGSGTVSYSLVDNAGSRFAINATTGAITLSTTAVDWETSTNHQYAITIRATNAQGHTDETLNVNVVYDPVFAWTTGSDDFTAAAAIPNTDILNASNGIDTFAIAAGGALNKIAGIYNLEYLNGTTGNDNLNLTSIATEATVGQSLTVNLDAGNDAFYFGGYSSSAGSATNYLYYDGGAGTDTFTYGSDIAADRSRRVYLSNVETVLASGNKQMVVYVQDNATTSVTLGSSTQDEVRYVASAADPANNTWTTSISAVEDVYMSRSAATTLNLTNALSANRVFGSAGYVENVYLLSGSANTVATGSNNVNGWYGSAGNESLTIGAVSGATTFDMGGGNDNLSLTSNGSVLTINLGAGDDTYRHTGAISTANLTGGTGADTVSVNVGTGWVTWVDFKESEGDKIDFSQFLTAGSIDSSHVRFTGTADNDVYVEARAQTTDAWDQVVRLQGATSTSGLLNGNGVPDAVNQTQLDTLRDAWLTGGVIHA